MWLKCSRSLWCPFATLLFEKTKQAPRGQSSTSHAYDLQPCTHFLRASSLLPEVILNAVLWLRAPPAENTMLNSSNQPSSLLRPSPPGPQHVQEGRKRYRPALDQERMQTTKPYGSLDLKLKGGRSISQNSL